MKINKLAITQKLKELLKHEDCAFVAAKTDIGKYRDINEDSVLTLNHKDDENIKLLAVADGVGGGDYGYMASYITMEQLEKWFNSLNKDVLNNKELIIELLKDKVEKINKLIRDKSMKLKSSFTATTLTMALVLEKETIILNIGDSRTYSVKDDKLTQLTEDDSIVWPQYKYGLIEKDEIRFSPINNFINKSLGQDSDKDLNPAIKVISNDSYDRLLLFSDGITDILSDKKISILSKKTNKKKLVDKLINQAVNVNQKDGTTSGKDNASVALYIKK